MRDFLHVIIYHREAFDSQVQSIIGNAKIEESTEDSTVSTEQESPIVEQPIQPESGEQTKLVTYVEVNQPQLAHCFTPSAWAAYKYKPALPRSGGSQPTAHKPAGPHAHEPARAPHSILTLRRLHVAAARPQPPSACGRGPAAARPRPPPPPGGPDSARAAQKAALLSE